MPALIKRIKRHLQDGAANLLTPPVLACLGALSDKSAMRLARLTASLTCLARTQAWKQADANLQIAFPQLSQAERQALLKSSLVNAALTGLEVMRLIRHPQRLKDIVHTPEKRFLDLTVDQPLIVCLPHLGNWEVFGQAAPLFGMKSSAVAEPLRNKKLDTLLEKSRSLNGLEIIQREGAARKVLRALHNNYTVGLLIDQNLSPRDGGIFSTFFGLPAPGSPLPAVLAKKLNINLVVGASIRNPDHTFSFEFEYLPKPVNQFESADELTQTVYHAFEAIIRRHPEQYTWMYHRWRYIPQNASAELQGKYPFYSVIRPYDCPEDVLKRATP